MKTPFTPKPIQNPIARFGILGLSTGLGLGYMPFAPGTFGSLLGIPFGLLLLQLPPWFGFASILLLIFLTAPVVERACHHWGLSDSPRVVWDEVLGQAIALLGLRATLGPENFDGSFHVEAWHLPPLLNIFEAFVLFRIFDIFKPFPAKIFDRKTSGMGVILDDIVAGLYAAFLVWILYRLDWPI